MDIAKIRSDFASVSAKALYEWGWFRRLIATHPLTGFLIGLVLGAAVGTFVTWILP